MYGIIMTIIVTKMTNIVNLQLELYVLDFKLLIINNLT